MEEITIEQLGDLRKSKTTSEMRAYISEELLNYRELRAKLRTTIDMCHLLETTAMQREVRGIFNKLMLTAINNVKTLEFYREVLLRKAEVEEA